MSLYIRIKRLKETVFLRCEPSNTVQVVMNQLKDIINVPVDRQRFIFNDATLDVEKTLEDQKVRVFSNQNWVVENDNVIFLVLKKEGSEDWEDVAVPKFGESAE